MSGKSRRKRGKYSVQSKKKKDRLSRPTIPAQQPAVAPVHEPVFPPNVSVPSATVPTTLAKPAAVQHHYIVGELWTIGILAGMMLIILAVLALVLS